MQTHVLVPTCVRHGDTPNLRGVCASEIILGDGAHLVRIFVN